MRQTLYFFAIWMSCFPVDSFAELTFFEPTLYRSLADSPCNSTHSTQNFFVEDFEDGIASFPIGVSTHPGFVRNPGPTTDSVDGDDGLLDGNGMNGHAFVPTVVFQGPTLPPLWETSYVLSFDEHTLGYLPVCAGLVITDGMPGLTLIVLSALDVNDNSTHRQYLSLFDDRNDGNSNEDRFIGVESLTGIRQIHVGHVYQDFGYQQRFEIDHIQFGWMVPETAVPCLKAFVLIALTAFRKPI